MAEVFEIKRYQYYSFSTRESGSKAVAICMGDAGKAVYVHFIGDSGNLLEAQKLNNNTYIIYYRHSDMQNIIDMLRNEKPVYLIYMPEGTNNIRLSTGSEPVGEGEEH